MSVILFLVILVILVVVHELGHFTASKLYGIRVEEFGVGFPPRLLGRRFGETLYSLNALPFGGFVRIFGENPADLARLPAERHRSMLGKSRGIQALVLVAGVTCNLLFAWLLLSCGFMVGMPTSVDEAHRGEVQNAKLLITSVVPNSPADSAGLKAGDIPVAAAVEGESVRLSSPSDLPDFVSAHESERVTLSVVRQGKTVDIAVQPRAGIIPSEPSRKAVGVVAELVGTQRYGLFRSLYEGGTLTADMLRNVLTGFWHLITGAFTGSSSIKEITGPVGIVGAVGEASTLGLIYLITFSAFISVNLSIVNLIPLPALDGGRLLFLLIETLKGSPIRPRFAQLLNSIGFALLILLMLVVTYNDVARLAG